MPRNDMIMRNPKIDKKSDIERMIRSEDVWIGLSIGNQLS
jgi:hypothetical protein